MSSVSRMGGMAAAIVVSFLAMAPANADPIKIEGGLIEGRIHDGIAVYQGIPFAAPPTGDLRWKPPAPVAPWPGVRRAIGYAPICPQSQAFNTAIGIPPAPMSEDCLYLNIWSSAKSPNENLPVMVWIYGGAFSIGSTTVPAYDGEALAKRGVVLVTISYRVGAFGFLAHKELSAESPAHGSGTYGLMDQIAALKWVQANIAAFGGDPKRVTIFGESAGAISVSMLCASPRAKGLFRAAISESGGSFSPPRVLGPEGGMATPSLALAERLGDDLLTKLGVHSIAEARRLSMDTILANQGKELVTYWPAMDGDVLPADQYGLYEAHKYNDVPVLIGSNSDEGAPFVPEMTAAAHTAIVRGAYGTYADKILASYPAADDAQALRSARDLFRDAAFGWHTAAWARLQSRTGHSKVFVYYFTHRPPYPPAPMFKDWGAGHAADIDYAFGYASPRWTDADRKLSDTMMTYWTNFAKTGDPNGAGVAAWPAFTPHAQKVLRLDNETEILNLPNAAQISVLDGYYAWRRSLSH